MDDGCVAAVGFLNVEHPNFKRSSKLKTKTNSGANSSKFFDNHPPVVTMMLR